MIIHPKHKRLWAEINLDAARSNYLTVKNQIKNETKLCCVIKANAYGHGAVRLAKLYRELGVDYFAVSNIEEALQLRRADIETPILILGYTAPECVELLFRERITQCVFSEEYGKSLSDAAVAKGVYVTVHIKVDTGMGRIGFHCYGEHFDVDAIERTYKLRNLDMEGIFTHFASADEGEVGEDYTLTQFEKFSTVIGELGARGCRFAIRHCANSAAIFDYPNMHLDMVRAGIVLYGALPSRTLKNAPRLRSVLKLKTIVSHVKSVSFGESVSYGREFTAQKEITVATIPTGYADGLWRSNSKNGLMLEVAGRRAPIIGRICMDQCMLDVTGIDGVGPGSEVVIYGDGECSVDRIAELNNTINYEIFCAIGARVPRIYIE